MIRPRPQRPQARVDSLSPVNRAIEDEPLLVHKDQILLKFGAYG
jgi:hypothetical protein